MKKVVLLIIIVVFIVLAGVYGYLNMKKDFEINDTNISKARINYEIITDKEIIKALELEDKKEKCHEIIRKDNIYYLIIHYEEIPAYYSKLEVISVDIDGNKIEVKVKLPEGGFEGKGEAFSYPKAVIKLDKEPEKINIIYKEEWQ